LTRAYPRNPRLLLSLPLPFSLTSLSLRSSVVNRFEFRLALAYN